MNASALFKKIRVKNVIGTLDIQVDDITTDSRTAKEGSLFVASKGYTVDSHKFCQNVVDQGCGIVVVNRELELKGNVTQVVVPDTLRVASLLAHELYEFPSHQLTTYGVTVSSHGLALGRLRGVEFDVAIFSNLTQDHLDFHGTMEAYGHAKSLLFSQLGEDLSKEKYVVLNNDDDFSDYLASVTPYEVFTYGITHEAQFMAKNIKESLQGVEFEFCTPFVSFPVKSPYVGRFNISNIMAAMIAVWSKGTNLNEIINAVTELEPVEGRLEVLDPSLPIDLIIDYAHTADGMNKLIDAVQPFVKQKLIFLVGMAGERDLTKTPEMGRVACRADYVIFTPDNPANDDPKMLTAELAKGATHNNYIEFDDRAEGIRHAIDIAEPGDTVVLASKGREPYQIMPGHVKVPHRDDLIGLKAAYQKFGGGPLED